MHLYDQLRQLQYIPHAFDTWKFYRQSITSILIGATCPGDTLALFGIGAGNDINLAQLLQADRKLILIDRDGTSINHALNQYHLQESPNLQIRVIDFLGINDADYYQYVDSLIAEIQKRDIGIGWNNLADYAYEQITTITHRFFENSYLEHIPHHDYAVLIGIYSQLLSIFDWIWQIILQTLNYQDESVRNHLDKLYLRLIRHLHNKLLRVTKKGLIVAYETERIGRPGIIAGSYHAEIDLQERTLEKELSLIQQKELYWPFDLSQNIAYKVSIEVYKR